jgi:hypothetical protein
MDVSEYGDGCELVLLSPQRPTAVRAAPPASPGPPGAWVRQGAWPFDPFPFRHPARPGPLDRPSALQGRRKPTPRGLAPGPATSPPASSSRAPHGAPMAWVQLSAHTLNPCPFRHPVGPRPSGQSLGPQGLLNPTPPPHELTSLSPALLDFCGSVQDPPVTVT